MSRQAVIDAPFTATVKQQEFANHWYDPACRRLLFVGALRSGKTQAAGRLFVETAIQHPSVYLVARLTYRELEDSTKKAMLHGDGSIPPLIPPEVIAEYRKSDNLVRLKSGATILFRSLDEPAKLLNLTLGGIFVDQIEELDPGAEGEHIFDTMLGRLSDPAGPRKLMAVANPASTVHWVYRRFVDPRHRDEATRMVHASMRDNAEHLPADYVAEMEATKLTRPYWFRTYVLGEWGAFEGAAFTEFDQDVHVVEPFPIPDWWQRFESLDHGASNPTAALAWAVDDDGNAVVFDEYYAPGLVSSHAPEILRRRRFGGVVGGSVTNPWQHGNVSNTIWADPSAWAAHGLSTKFGQPASIATEYAEHDIHLIRANNDRAAGYMRLLELIHVDPARFAPPWAQIPDSVKGAPRLYVFKHCEHLIEQIKGAPIATDGSNAGECVDPKWASAHGHALDSCRYGAMSRPSPSSEPKPPSPDARRAYLDDLNKREFSETEELRVRRYHYV